MEMPRQRDTPPPDDAISFGTIALVPRFLAHGIFLLAAVIWGGIWSEHGLTPEPAEGYRTYFWTVVVPGGFLLGTIVTVARFFDRLHCELRRTPVAAWLVATTALAHSVRCGATTQTTSIAIVALAMAAALQLSALQEAHASRAQRFARVRMRDVAR